MPEVIVVCEGPTEREFCNRTLRGYVEPKGVTLSGTLVGKPNRKTGGIQVWKHYRKEVIRLAMERAERHVALLVDFYGLPLDWPGCQEAKAKPTHERGLWVEEKLKEDVRDDIGNRFLPCVQLHEFEALLFVEPEISALSIAVGGFSGNPERLARNMAEMRDECGGVEAIDDSPQTAPSKRLRALVPGYDKVGWGLVAAKDTGVDALRQGCPWLDRWLNSIEALGGE